MNPILKNEIESIYDNSDDLKNLLSKNEFAEISEKLFMNSEIIEDYYLDYQFLSELDSCFSNSHIKTIKILKELYNQKVIGLSRLMECDSCGEEKIMQIKDSLNKKGNSENSKLNFDCENCFTPLSFDLIPDLENEEKSKEYSLLFYLTGKYSDLIKENVHGIKVKKSLFGNIFRAPFKTRNEFIEESKDPLYPKKKAIEIKKKNPLNFSVWNPPMEKMLENNQKIKTIHSHFFFLTPNLLEDIYEGKENNKEEFFGMIPEEWMKKKNVFMRTGTFSNKFQFDQPHIKNMKESAYESYMNIAYQALMVGADQPIEVVLREFIENKGNRPTIYHGMPLNTEFRFFYDFDKEDFLGVANYWHPELMIPGLEKNSMYDDEASKDLKTYKGIMDTIIKEFEEDKKSLAESLKVSLLNNKEENGYKFNGVWSIDIMKSGEEYYFIDMAIGSRSALINQIEEI